MVVLVWRRGGGREIVVEAMVHQDYSGLPGPDLWCSQVQGTQAGREKRQKALS